MLRVYLFLGMIGLTNYLNFAKEHNRKLNRYEGIMIWNPKFGSLPQDVLFVPAYWDKKGSFEDFLKNEFSKKDFIIYQIYFQGIRWILPDLEQKLNDTKYVAIGLGYEYQISKVSYVALTFSPDSMIEEELNIINELPIMIDGEKKIIRLYNGLSYMGNAKLYESIFW